MRGTPPSMSHQLEYTLFTLTHCSFQKKILLVTIKSMRKRLNKTFVVVFNMILNQELLSVV